MSDYSNYEVVFVDNASSDGSVKTVKDLFGSQPSFRIVENDNNYGFAEGNNRGFAQAKGEYVVFLNNDTEVKSSWLKELVKVMESDSTIAIAQAKLLHLYDRTRLQVCGYLLSEDGSLLPRGAGEVDGGQYDYVTNVMCATATAMIVSRTRLVNQTNVFDPEYFFGDEDLDLCWRAWLAGYRVVFVPASVVYHASGGTLRSKSRIESNVRQWAENYYYHSTKSRMTIMLKALETVNVIRLFPLRLYLSLLESFWNDLQVSQPKHILLFTKALVSVIRGFRTILIKRQAFQRARRVKDKQIFQSIMTTETILGRLTLKKKSLILKAQLGIPY
jgi:GT2 family glycosyltransferase